MLSRREILKLALMSPLVPELESIGPMVPIDRLRDWGIDLGKFHNAYVQIYVNALAKYGQRYPIWIDSKYRVLSGQGVVMAAKLLGMKTLKCEVMTHQEFERIRKLWVNFHYSAIYCLEKPC